MMCPIFFVFKEAFQSEKAQNGKRYIIVPIRSDVDNRNVEIGSIVEGALLIIRFASIEDKYFRRLLYNATVSGFCNVL